MTPRRALNLIAGVALLGGIAYWVYLFLSAEDRVKAICAQIRPGMTVPELTAFATRQGLRGHTPDNGDGVLVETKTYGRFGCTLTLASGRVQQVRYHWAD